jgi:hypothetical protein
MMIMEGVRVADVTSMSGRLVRKKEFLTILRQRSCAVCQGIVGMYSTCTYIRTAPWV